MKHNDINGEQIKNALLLKKKVPIYLEENKKSEASSLLKKELNLSEVFDVIDFVTAPYFKQLSDARAENSVLQILVNKLGATEEQWLEAQNEFDETQKTNQERLEKEFKKAVEESKRGE